MLIVYTKLREEQDCICIPHIHQSITFTMRSPVPGSEMDLEIDRGLHKWALGRGSSKSAPGFDDAMVLEIATPTLIRVHCFSAHLRVPRPLRLLLLRRDGW